MAEREYNASENTIDKNDLFYKWQKAAGGTLNFSPGLSNIRSFLHVDLTAGPGIDKFGNRNVLLRSIDAHKEVEVFDRMQYIAFEEDRERFKRLVDTLRGENLLSELYAPECGKVVAVNGLFGDYAEELKKIAHKRIGEICFDPVPDGKSIIDAKLIAEIFPTNMSISSYVGQNSMARVTGMLEKQNRECTRDGLTRDDWDYERLLSELRGSRTHAFASKKMGSAGGRVAVFTIANKKPPGMSNLDEGIQRDFFS